MLLTWHISVNAGPLPYYSRRSKTDYSCFSLQLLTIGLDRRLYIKKLGINMHLRMDTVYTRNAVCPCPCDSSPCPCPRPCGLWLSPCKSPCVALPITQEAKIYLPFDAILLTAPHYPFNYFTYLVVCHCEICPIIIALNCCQNCSATCSAAVLSTPVERGFLQSGLIMRLHMARMTDSCLKLVFLKCNSVPYKQGRI